jgi:hypothetical protein
MPHLIAFKDLFPIIGKAYIKHIVPKTVAIYKSWTF